MGSAQSRCSGSSARALREFPTLRLPCVPALFRTRSDALRGCQCVTPKPQPVTTPHLPSLRRTDRADRLGARVERSPRPQCSYLHPASSCDLPNSPRKVARRGIQPTWSPTRTSCLSSSRSPRASSEHTSAPSGAMPVRAHPSDPRRIPGLIRCETPGVFRKVDGLNNDRCHAVHELKGCEDMYLHRQSGLAYLPCTPPETRAFWTPALLKLKSVLSRSHVITLATLTTTTQSLSRPVAVWRQDLPLRHQDRKNDAARAREPAGPSRLDGSAPARHRPLRRRRHGHHLRQQPPPAAGPRDRAPGRCRQRHRDFRDQARLEHGQMGRDGRARGHLDAQQSRRSGTEELLRHKRSRREDGMGA